MTKAEPPTNLLMTEHEQELVSILRQRIAALEAQDNEKVQAIIKLDSTIFKLIAENGELEAQLARRDARIRNVADLMTNACMILDTIKQEWGDAWSEWDQSIRDGMSKWILAAAAKAGEGK